MQYLTYEYQATCGVQARELAGFGKELAPIIEQVAKAIGSGDESHYGFAKLPNTPVMVTKIKAVIQAKKALRPTALVVIGIGGSNLGTVAVHALLNGKLYNEEQPTTKIYFADTVDSDYILDITMLIEQELQKENTIILNIISKSGGTTETVANAEIFLAILKRYRPVDYQKCVVVTTDYDSALWQLAEKEQFTTLEIPKLVGGRYSVLSAVGLFPLGLIGVDIQELLNGALSMNALCVNDAIEQNLAASSAAIQHALYKRNIAIHDTFIFSVDGESLGKWYRQLVGESLGKEFNVKGERAPVGITPTVSLGSTDLHSVGQLYLGGPVRHFTTFVTFKKLISEVQVPVFKNFEHLVANIQGKSLPWIMQAIEQGVKAAYLKNNRPFASLVIPEKSAFCVGQFLQLKMFEIVYLGYLLGVNPFDQPNVESYKQETRKILNS